MTTPSEAQERVLGAIGALGSVEDARRRGEAARLWHVIEMLSSSRDRLDDEVERLEVEVEALRDRHLAVLHCAPTWQLDADTLHDVRGLSRQTEPFWIAGPSGVAR